MYYCVLLTPFLVGKEVLRVSDQLLYFFNLLFKHYVLQLIGHLNWYPKNFLCPWNLPRPQVHSKEPSDLLF